MHPYILKLLQIENDICIENVVYLNILHLIQIFTKKTLKECL